GGRTGPRRAEGGEPAEALRHDGPAVYVGDERGIQRGRIIGDRPPVDAVIGRRLAGGRKQANERERRDTDDAPARRPHTFRTVYSPPPPSAFPMAANNWVEPVVPDSMTGATRSNEARASVTAMSFVIDVSPFRRLVAPTMGAPFRRRGGETGNSTAKESSVSEGEQVREMPEWCPERSQRRWPVAVHRRPLGWPVTGRPTLRTRRR